MRAVILLLITLVAVGLAQSRAVSPVAADHDDDHFEEAECPMEIPFGLEEDDLLCGYVMVPADRDVAAGKELRLAVAVIKAQSETPKPDPIVFLSGGPGGSALQSDIQALAFDGAPLYADRDFVFFDQRGTGFSEPDLSCPELDGLFASNLLDPPSSLEEEQRRFENAFFTCRDRFSQEGIRLSGLTSIESSHDIADIAAALGYEDYNLLGISYGTRLGLAALRYTPEHVRSVLLDSVYPPTSPSDAGTAATFQRALNVLFAGCAKHAACHAAYPDFEANYWQLIADANADPFVFEISGPAGETATVEFTGNNVIGATFSALYDTAGLAALPFILDQASNGISGPLSIFVQDWLYPSFGFSAFTYWAVTCNEEQVFINDETVEESNEGVRKEILESGLFLTDASGLRGFEELCAALRPGPLVATERLPVESEIPALIFAGEYDPITPPDDGREAAATLANGTFIEFPSTGHSAIVGQTDCAVAIAVAFFADPEAAVDASCVSDIGPPAWSVESASEEPPLPEPSPQPEPSPPPVGTIQAPDTGYGPDTVPRRGARRIVLALAWLGVTCVAFGLVRRRPARL